MSLSYITHIQPTWYSISIIHWFLGEPRFVCIYYSLAWCSCCDWKVKSLITWSNNANWDLPATNRTWSRQTDDYIKPEQLSSFTNSCLGAAYEKQSILCKHRVICEWTLKNTSSEELIDFCFKCHSISPLIGKQVNSLYFYPWFIMCPIFRILPKPGIII